MQHLTKIEQALPVYVVRTRNSDNDECYFILRTTPARYERLRSKQKKTPVNIAEYGEILASGYGPNPTKRVIDHLFETHNISLPEHLSSAP